MTEFEAACRDAAIQYGSDISSLPRQLKASLQALALTQHDWSDLPCCDVDVARIFGYIAAAIIARSDPEWAAKDEYFAACRKIGCQLEIVASEITYVDLVEELARQHANAHEPADEHAQADARDRARAMK